MTNETSAPRPVSVIVPTSKGPSAILDLMEEIPNPGRSTAALGDTTMQAGIGSAYNDFVKSPPGVVHRLFGLSDFPSYRLSVSDPVETGFSWQLPVLLAHALLQDGGRLAGPEAAGADLVWATGAVSPIDYAVGAVGHVAEKLRSSRDLFARALAAGRRVRILLPAGNVHDVDPDTASWLDENGLSIEAVVEADEAFRMLGLPPVPKAASRTSVPTVTAWRGNPYRGLEPFLGEHRAVFFGRARARETAVDLLATGAARGRPFLLVHGRSGVGKSSLVHAGIAGDVVARLPAGPRTATVAIRPAEGGGSPCAALRAGLRTLLGTAGEHVGDDASPGGTAADLVERLLGEDGAHGTGLLVVDQLEEIFDPAVDEADAQAFCDLLERLCRTRSTWIVATMRSDAMGSIGRYPALARLAASERVFRLDPPSQFELCEIVAAPAAVAGRPFADRRLVERLAEIAAASPDSLPLLQTLLYRLHDSGVPVDAAMLERVGGFEGVVGRWAEEVRQGILDAGVPSGTLDLVLTGLVRIDPATRVPMSRPMPVEAALRAGIDDDALPGGGPTSSQGRTIVDGLVEGRIAVVADGVEGPQLRLSHEVLTTSWPHMVHLVERLGEAIRIRDDLQERTDVWIRSGRHDGELLRGFSRTAAIAELLDEGLVEVGDDAALFLVRSLQAAMDEEDREKAGREAEIAAARERVRNARTKQRLSAAAALAATIAAVVLAGGWKYTTAQVDALERTGRIATEQREAAETNLSRFVAARADAVSEEQPLLAQQALLTVLPEDRSKPIPVATGDALVEAWRADGFLFGSGSGHRVRRALWNGNGLDVTWLMPNRVFAVSDGATGAVERSWRLKDEGVFVSKADLRGGRFVAAGDGKLRSWTDLEADPDWSIEPSGGHGRIGWVEMDRAGERVGVVHADGVVDILDARTGTTTSSFGTGSGSPPAYDGPPPLVLDDNSSEEDGDRDTVAEARVRAEEDAVRPVFAGFDSDGTRVAVATKQGDVILRSTSDASLLFETKAGRDIVSAALSPNGRLVAVGDATGGVSMLFPEPSGHYYLWPQRETWRGVLTAHSGSVDQIAWSPDGRRLLTLSRTKGAKVWDARSRRLLGTIADQGFGILRMAWSPDGTRLLGESKDEFRVWKAPSPDDPATSDPSSSPTLDRDPHLVLADHAGSRILVALDSGKVEIRSASDPSLPVLGVLEDAPVLRARWSPDDRRIAVNTGGGLCVYDVGTSRRETCEDGGGFGTAAPDWSPDGLRIVSSGYRSPIRIRNMETGISADLPGSMSTGYDIVDLAWSPDGSRIAVGHLGGMTVVSATDGSVLLEVPDDGEAPYLIADADLSPDRSLSWNRDGTRLLWTRSTGRAYVVDASTGAVSRTSDRKEKIRAASWDPSGRLFLTTSQSGRIRIFDADRLVLLRTIEPPVRVRTATWTASGAVVAGAAAGVERRADAGGDGLLVKVVMKDPHVHDRLAIFDVSDVRPFDVLADVVRIGTDDDLAFAEGPFEDLVRERPTPERSAADVDACDAEAGNPYDPDMPIRGTGRIRVVPDTLVSFEKAVSIEPCLAATKAHPEEPRFEYALSRSYLALDRTEERIAHLRRAAEAGHAMALFDLAQALESGAGVAKDPSAARAAYAKARDGGVLAAWQRLGSMDARGVGVARDLVAAEASWRAGAEAGDPESHVMLAGLAGKDRPGHPSDPVAALRHLAVAVDIYSTFGDVDRMREAKVRRAALARLVDPDDASAVAREIEAVVRRRAASSAVEVGDFSSFMDGLFGKIVDRLS